MALIQRQFFAAFSVLLFKFAIEIHEKWNNISCASFSNVLTIINFLAPCTSFPDASGKKYKFYHSTAHYSRIQSISIANLNNRREFSAKKCYWINYADSIVKHVVIIFIQSKLFCCFGPFTLLSQPEKVL